MTGSMSVVMIGATGAVGERVARHLARSPNVERLTLLGRRTVADLAGDRIHQHQVDVEQPASYRSLLAGHQAAVCTLGIGQPSRVDPDTFVRIDKLAVLGFATECQRAGVRGFHLLSSVGANPKSRSLYLRTKGELEVGLESLRFERLALFEPSMILTPTNRYGVGQGILLRLWPAIGWALVGPLRKYRGIAVDRLALAIARSVIMGGKGTERMTWDRIERLSREPGPD